MMSQYKGLASYKESGMLLSKIDLCVQNTSFAKVKSVFTYIKLCKLIGHENINIREMFTLEGFGWMIITDDAREIFDNPDTDQIIRS